ncbi:MFS transporter [Alkalihalobacillus sp. MEB130]|uniref:MFS transporter n=1 Tax=Alkalihalobacillus sp. MEB130 TaxID=2976704 RepID=UPI0028DDD3F0|nr:MFS transporter [Alkalihalobacillus sp. MEB130]MDT8859235.1 MFS transporter [Alkalihalobacillus sp. MEB130]
MKTHISNKEKNLFLIVSFAIWFPHFIYLPILSPYMELMGGTYIFIGIVLSSYGFMQFLFRLPIGMSSDLLKIRKPFIVLGLLIGAVSCFIFALTDSLGWILFARSLAGIAAATWVVFAVLYSSYFLDSEVHKAMSAISFVVVLAQLLGMLFSGYLVNAWGWATPFWIGGVVSLVGAVLALFIFEPKDSGPETPVNLKALTGVMKDSHLLKISFLSILAHSIIFTTTFGFIPNYVTSIGLEANEISLIVFAFMIPHAIATLFIGKWIVPHFGKWRSLKYAFLLAAIFTLLTPFVESKALLMIVQGINGFALGLLFPLLLGMSIETISPEKRATAMGVYQALYAIGMFTGPLLAGVLNSNFGISAGFYFTGLLGLIACMFIVIWESKKKQQSKKSYKMSS